jgi:proline utilization trans-activator
LTTRPILFHLFRTKIQPLNKANTIPAKPLSPVTSALAEACVQAARTQNSILAQLWVEGSIAVFGYFDANYIFSSTIILMVATIAIKGDRDQDQDAVDTAWSLLRSMRDDGNLPAEEYYDQLLQLRTDLNQVNGNGMGRSNATSDVQSTKSANSRVNAATTKTTTPNTNSRRVSQMGESAIGATGLDDPFIHDFLMQTDAQLSMEYPGISEASLLPWSAEWEDVDTFGSLG